MDTDSRNGYKVTTSSRILYPGEIHTESYLLLHAFDTLEQAENFASFMALKFPRFMMKHTLSSMNITCYYAIIKNNSDVALTKGIGLGFGVAIIVFFFVTACFDWKDRRGVSND